MVTHRDISAVGNDNQLFQRPAFHLSESLWASENMEYRQLRSGSFGRRFSGVFQEQFYRRHSLACRFDRRRDTGKLRAGKLAGKYLPRPVFFLSDDRAKTVLLGVTRLFDQYQTDWSKVPAVLTLSAIPVIALYLVASKQFIQGLTAGAVKG
jgi:hypothetical protein